MSRTYNDTATKSPIVSNWFVAMAGNKQNLLIIISMGRDLRFFNNICKLMYAKLRRVGNG